MTPRHDDDTLCGHELTAHGKALDAGCSGAKDYQAVCVCGWTQTGAVQASLAYAHARHVRYVRELVGVGGVF
ncbi:hypothetical protein [Streptomyces sp. G1]|uniref:hypothetical protein n=1 Tax=Streptomyces sp. G1 TaxID=361572 RepID=UPI0020307A41|nr:hypothetical protein [Streptomyces sp. G1]MCM1964912.1 hypothetical protein [Streptomyces sp. G1]